MRALLALLVIALVSLGESACGGVTGRPGQASQASSGATESGSSSATTSASAALHEGFKLDADNDYDNPGTSHYDSDDSFGHVANAADERAVTALLKSYYAAATAANGAAACSLLYSLIAESVVEEYGQSSGPSALRGKTCAGVMLSLFKQHHQQLSADATALKVVRVIINDNQGWALLDVGMRLERRMLVHREHGAWKIDMLLDTPVP